LSIFYTSGPQAPPPPARGFVIPWTLAGDVTYSTATGNTTAVFAPHLQFTLAFPGLNVTYVDGWQYGLTAVATGNLVAYPKFSAT
jgi:hypothetical protein